MDILYYAGLQRYHDVLKCNIGIKSGNTTVSAASVASISTAGGLTGGIGVSTGDTTLTNLNNCWMSICNSLLLCRVATACTLNVCDTSGYYRCGACCLWTVPAGVTFAEFQLWGPGGGTSAICCCGGSPPGPSGAYVVAGIPVTAGATYTICAGCAYCCYASQTTPGITGGPSWVTGTGLTNLCAMSGYSSICYYNASHGYTGSNYKWYSNLNNAASNAMCNCEGYWNFCAGTSTTISSDFAFSCYTKPYGTVSGTGSYAYGIPGMYPRMCIGSTCAWAQNTFMKSPPIFGFNLSCCWTDIALCASSIYTGYCSSPLAGGNYAKGPGQGGAPSVACGGTSAATYYGDAGRMGMVKITYC